MYKKRISSLEKELKATKEQKDDLIKKLTMRSAETIYHRKNIAKMFKI